MLLWLVEPTAPFLPSEFLTVDDSCYELGLAFVGVVTKTT